MRAVWTLDRLIRLMNNHLIKGLISIGISGYGTVRFLIHLSDKEIGHLSFEFLFYLELCYYQCQYVGTLLLTYY